MAAGNELDEDTGASESRQRLRPWLISKLDKEQIPDLCWINKAEMVFKIPWKHGGKQDWVPQQGQIFMVRIFVVKSLLFQYHIGI